MLDASLLGLDISGFTALSERLQEKGKLGAEELIVLISRCYSGLIDIAQRYGGDVLKFRGDALLLVFEGDGHENRAACAALAMQRFIAAGGAAGESSVGPVELSMCAGLVSGQCHFFLLGRHHRELIVCGPSASATLELEDAAESGEVLVSRAHRRGAGGLRRRRARRRLPPAARRGRRGAAAAPRRRGLRRRRALRSSSRRRSACRSRKARSRPSTAA